MSVSALRARRLSEPAADPFGERRRVAWRARAQLLGGQFRFECSDPVLLRIVQAAYAHLPAHRLKTPAPRFAVRLLLLSARVGGVRAPEPPLVTALAGGGMLCGAVGASSFVAIAPQRRSALIVLDRDMLRFPYHIRYELLEFAVYTLAARAQGLAPLHAACVGQDGAGVLLVGPSGSGKSTVTLHCLLAGLDFLAEDSVMVRPKGLLATGVANFLHVRRDSLRFLDRAARAELLTGSSLIQRRSGVRKFEIDLRRPHYHLAAAPLRVRAVVFLSARPAGTRPLLTRLRTSTVTRRLANSQRYAARQPGWSTFRDRLLSLPAYELRRGTDPREAVEALRMLLARDGRRSVRVRSGVR